MLRALQDRHGWTLQELVELEVHLFRDPEDKAYAGGMPDIPLVLPDHAPLGSAFSFLPSVLPAPADDHYSRNACSAWRDFKAQFIAHSKDPSHRDSLRK